MRKHFFNIHDIGLDYDLLQLKSTIFCGYKQTHYSVIENLSTTDNS